MDVEISVHLFTQNGSQEENFKKKLTKNSQPEILAYAFIKIRLICNSENVLFLNFHLAPM